MTTTDLIKILSDNEYGAISRKPRNISLTINGKYMPNPRITLSSTGDGICGAEIDLDVDGEFYEEQEPCKDVSSNVPHKIAEFFSNWDGDEDAKMEISVDDMREIAFVYTKKARIERQLKEKALEQQPCEDCISREDILNHQYTIDESEALGISTRNVVNVDDILNAKPVQPKSKTGHWINRHIIANTSIDMIVCSECGEEFSYDAETGISEYNYCPNCGAKMIETQESEGKE